MQSVDPRLMKQFMPGMQMPMDPSAVGSGAGNGLALGVLGGAMSDVGAAGVGNPQAGGIPNYMPPDMGGAVGIPNVRPPGGDSAAGMPNFYPMPPAQDNMQRPVPDSVEGGLLSPGVDPQGGQQGEPSPFQRLGDAFKEHYKKEVTEPDIGRNIRSAFPGNAAREKLIRALIGIQ